MGDLAAAVEILAAAALLPIGENMKKLFSKEDLQKIKDKVTQTEKLTDAEIVPFITLKSSDYLWIHCAGILFGWVVSSLLIVVLSFNSPWALSLSEYLLLQIFFMAAGAAFSFTRPFKKIVLRKSQTTKIVENLAYATFLRLGVHRTKNRCGVLLFVSLLEKKILLIADEGVYHKMPKAFWQSQVDALSKGIREGNEIQTLSSIIDGLGRKLAEFFPFSGSRQSELPDEPKTPEN